MLGMGRGAGGGGGAGEGGGGEYTLLLCWFGKRLELTGEESESS